MVGRKKILVLTWVLSLCAVAHADLVPMFLSDDGYRPSPQTLIPTDPLPSPSSSCVDFVGIADLDVSPVGVLLETTAETERADELRSPRILKDEQNSLSLCLYALLGLGLCRSAPFVKKLHFGYLPDWYHTGGPFQIGHSVVISPECLFSAPACCFIQPDDRAKDHRPQDYPGLFAALLRKSQFTPITLASRGPPRLS